MKKYILLAFLIVTQVLGDIWLSRGMKSIGEVKSFEPIALFSLFIQVFTNIWIWLGIGFLILSLICYLTAVSKLDLSFVLPITSSNYVLNAVFAWIILGEQVSEIRWIGTLLVSIGVLIVGWSDLLPKPPPKVHKKDENLSNLSLLNFPLGVTLGISKTWLAIFAIVITDSLGDVLLAKGMKQVGEVEIVSIKQVINMIKNIITNYAIITGITCQAIAFFLFISALSWSDISLVRPATALGYFVSMIGAKFLLKEQIRLGRLVGTIIIGSGVAIISLT